MTPSPAIILQGSSITPDLTDAVAALAGAARVELRGPRCARLSGFAALPVEPVRLRIAALAEAARADSAFVPMPRPLGDFRLAVMDMDSTLISIECVDEIADMQGLKAEVSAITAAAMRGEIDFPASLKRRVALLAGLPVAALERVYEDRLLVTPGAETMLAAFRGAGLATLVVSGGFTFFTARLARRLGIDDARANTLGIEGGKLTGEVIGEIVDGAAKRRALLEACARLGAEPRQAIAIGDGANDLPMMEAAGISVAFHAKPVVRARATHSINHNGLDAVPPLFDC